MAERGSLGSSDQWTDGERELVEALERADARGQEVQFVGASWPAKHVQAFLVGPATAGSAAIASFIRANRITDTEIVIPK